MCPVGLNVCFWYKLSYLQEMFSVPHPQLAVSVRRCFGLDNSGLFPSVLEMNFGSI